MTPERPGLTRVMSGGVRGAPTLGGATVAAQPTGAKSEVHPLAVVRSVLEVETQVAHVSAAGLVSTARPPPSAAPALSTATVDCCCQRSAESSTSLPSVDGAPAAGVIGCAAVRGHAKRRRMRSPQYVRRPTASLTDLPVELLELVASHLCMADRLALGATSPFLRSACDNDSIYAAIGWAVLGVGATAAERRAWEWPDVSRRQPPLIPQLLSAQQGRAIVGLLRAVNTLYRAWDSWGVAGASCMDLLAWVDHFLTDHPEGLTNRHRPVGRGGCRQCIRFSVTTSAVVHVWGIPLRGSTAEQDCWEWSHGPTGYPEVAFNLWAVLRMTFFHVRPPTPLEPAPFDGSWGMPVAFSILRRRARRAAKIRRLAFAHVQRGPVSVVSGTLRYRGRPNFARWVEEAVRSVGGPLDRYFDGDGAVQATAMVGAIEFLAAVYDGVAAAWPVLTSTRRCAAHWAVLEKHVIREALSIAANGRTDAAAVSEAVEHATCVGAARLCMAWGRRMRPGSSRQPPCVVRWPEMEPEVCDDSTTDGGEDSLTDSSEDFVFE